ncbi:MAG: 8-amino-7-oxononanoate synthase [Planctomycetaceae bacterium]|nr:8-amino-7-oxononanoate synthase [Planctomycetaceae bacterium]MBT6483148.1 8-amino-7-oxononanoate synthase [Planctomycetaceae bacterium]MBT6497750.1 8-amino-7-oxononanoate synthase [Planctomycetaceae bacterium]
MSNDPTNTFPWLADELRDLERGGLLRKRRQVKSLPDGLCEIDGRRLVNFASNDYLNLAHDPRVIAAAREALESAGAGATASALVTGRTEWHARLEQRLAAFEGHEAAILFPTGYAANLGTITALVGDDDIVFCDRLNHASLIDGCKLSGARLRVYRHTQLDKLQRELEKAAGHRRRLIVTDSLFSMDGVPAPLVELCDLAERFDAALLIDEAHATGLFGEQGRGLAELDNIEEHPSLIRIGTLSKGLASLGGFVTGSQQLIDWLWNRARPQMFSTALPPSACAAAIAAIDIIEQEPERRQRLLETCDTFRKKLITAGLDVPEGGIGPIMPIILNDPERAVAAASELEEAGFLVAAIRPPTVPTGTSRLRITVTAGHGDETVDKLFHSLC